MNRLVRFWQRRSTRGRTLLSAVAVGAVVAVVGLIGAVSGRDVNPTAPSQTTATTQVTTASAPIRCLHVAGLSDVEEEDMDLWHGSHVRPPYEIVVHELAKPVRAPIVVAGTYVETGRFKVAAKATGLTSQEGLEADALVEEVADCLGG